MLSVLSRLVLPSLSLKESVLFTTTCALIVHIIYKRHEIQPSSYLLTALLLLVPPSISTVFYHQTIHSLWLSALASFTSFYLILISSIIAYRLSPMHPLYRYPGPLAAKVSKFWMVRVLRTGKMNEYVKSLHDRYGRYVRIGPNEISCIDTDALPDMFGPSGMPKGPVWDGRSDPEKTTPLIGLHDLHEHARQRKVWNRAFSTASIKDYEPVITKRVLQLADALEESSKPLLGDTSERRAVDISEWFGLFAFDFMGDMAFGGGFEFMRDGDKDQIWELMAARVKDVAFLSHVPWATRLLLKFPSVTGGVNKFRKFTEELARKRKEVGSSSDIKDLFYHLTNEDGIQKDPPSLESILVSGELAVIAGSDTTANTLSGVFYYLLMNPLEFKRLREEVDREFPRDEGEDAVDAARLASRMPVLNAVINETLRLQPAVMTYTQRAPAKGSGGHRLGERFIIEGTAVVAPIYAIHRDPSNFSPFPEEFHPDRWLNKPSQPASEFSAPSSQPDISFSDLALKWHTNTSAFMPFSTGPANCAGKNLAIAEMRAVVAVLVQRFDIAFAEDYDVGMYKVRMEDRFITQVGELKVVLRVRG
ncbi:high nitrogen upregulated cytochrome P450 monooxygenase 2 [Schizopora paradoxa]|uniref:High nitrogen upregulated cytochrome P450 monooxygenase 2 n=1 Tax=Schizopora paradoxa TaxID=27342 RepID=A0A0H2RPF4_9AGAM|nr:high nitrogen upregulated cytochrome P450 monooxygenase 2 [Schizopora paradoxa]